MGFRIYRKGIALHKAVENAADLTCFSTFCSTHSAPRMVSCLANLAKNGALMKSCMGFLPLFAPYIHHCIGRCLFCRLIKSSPLHVHWWIKYNLLGRFSQALCSNIANINSEPFSLYIQIIFTPYSCFILLH